MLAQINSLPPDFTHQATLYAVGIIGILSAAGSTIVGIMNYRRGGRREISPQPLEVRAAPDLVTHEQCAASHVDIDRRLASLANTVTQSEEYAKNRRQAIYEEIKSAREASATALEGLARELRVDMGKIHDRVTSLGIELAAVKNTGELGNQRLSVIETDIKQLLKRP
jgi:hypothetical protein